MPNHVTNVLTVTGDPERVEAFRTAHIRFSSDKESKEKWEHLDFQTVIPAPACVEGTEASNTAEEGFFALTGLAKTSFARFDGAATRYFERYEKEGFEVNALTQPEHLRAWLAKKHPEVLVSGQKMLTCFRETGCMSWYDWNSKNWGTKWNSYSYKERSAEPGKFVCVFDTAWAPPVPIFAKLAELWPDLRIETQSIDEGGGAWAGSGGKIEKVEETRELHLVVYGTTEGIDPSDEDEEDEEEESAEAAN